MRRNHSLDAFCQICVHIRHHTLSHTHHIFTICILCTYKSVLTLKQYPNSSSSLHEHVCSTLISIVFPPLLLDRRVSSKYHPILYETCPACYCYYCILAPFSHFAAIILFISPKFLNIDVG